MKPQLPSEVTLSPGDTITWRQFCLKMSRDLTQQYAKSKVKFTPELIESFAIFCLTGDDFQEDAPKEYYEANEQICRLLEQSKEYESMTQEPIEAPEVSAELNPSFNKDEDTYTILAPKEVLEEITEQPKEVNSQELLIVQKAMSVGREISMEEVRKSLEEKFDLGDNNQIVPKKGSIVSGADFGMAMAYGAKMEASGGFIFADAVNYLMQEGHEHVVEQIASMLGKSDKTLYNVARTARRVPQELRDGSIPISVYSEVACRKYDDDDKKNDEIIAELVADVSKQKMSCGEARSLADHKQGKDRPITDGSSRPQKYRYIVILPGLPPYLTHTQPGYSEGVQVIDLKTMEYLKDQDNKIEFVSIVKEPTDAQIQEMREGVK